MNKTIEEKFFEPFKPGGVVEGRIKYFREKYNLPERYPGHFDVEQNETDYEDISFFSDEEEDALKMFNGGILTPLFDEIEDNLNECRSDEQRERYVILSLLKPFTTCGFTKLLYPLCELSNLLEEVKSINKVIKSLERLTPKDDERILELEIRLAELKNQFKWVDTVRKKALAIYKKEDYFLSKLEFVCFRFGQMLEYTLLKFGIALNKIQNISGFYVNVFFIIDDHVDKFGNKQLARLYMRKAYNNTLEECSFGYPGEDIIYRTYEQQLECVLQRFENIDEYTENEPQVNNSSTDQQKDLPSSGENALQTQNKRGKTVKPFRACIYNDPNGDKLNKIKMVTEGKKDKNFIVIIKAAVELGWMSKPSHLAVIEEFGNVTSKSNYNHFMQDGVLTKDEIKRAQRTLLN